MSHTSTLQAAWEQQFPSTDYLITTLRQILVHADGHRQQTELAYTQLELDLQATQLPMPLWAGHVNKVFTQIHTYVVKAQRHFLHCLKALQATYKTSKPESLPNIQQLKTPEPEGPPGPGANFYQTISINYDESGNLLPTTASPTAEQLLNLIHLKPKSYRNFIRIFEFQDLKVPEPYTSLLTHQDIPQEPALRLMVSYSTEDFKNICQQEIESNAQHVLDGPRAGYERRP